MLVNSGLKLLVLAPLLFTQVQGTLWVVLALEHGFGYGPNWSLAPVALAGLFTLVFFLVDDASRFGLHWLLHKVPALWYLHRVHHSATSLTPITLYRVHTLEMALYFIRSLVVVSLVTGLFIYLFQGRITGWDLIGVNIFAFLFNLLGANLRHSPVNIHFGVFERWLVSPAQHQIHHSSDVDHLDKNFGSALSIWDRWAGTWVPGREARNLTYGLAPTEPAVAFHIKGAQ